MRSTRLRLGMLLLLAVYAGWTSLGWGRYPPVWVDEGWIAEAAWTHARTGGLGTPAHGELHRYADRVYWMPPLYFLAVSGAIQGGLDPLAAGRAVSWLAGFLGLWILLLLGNRLLHEPRGDSSQTSSEPYRPGFWLFWLGLMVLADPMLWKAHRLVRFESLTGLAVLGSVAAAVLSRGLARGLLVGGASAAAALTHPSGLFALPAAVGVLWFLPAERGARLRTSFLALAIFLIVSLPLLVYLAGDRGSGFANVLGQNAPHLTGRAAPVPVQWLLEWKRYRAYFAWPALALPLGLWMATLLLAGRAHAPRWLGWVFAVLVVGLASLPNKTELYLTLAAPFLYLLAAWTGSRWGQQRIAVTAALAWLVCVAGADAVLLRRDRACDYPAWTRTAVTPIPAGASIAGTYVTWFPVREHPYLEFHRRRAGDLAAARPDYVLWGGAHLEDPIFLRLRQELGPFLAAHAETLAVSTSPCYGKLTLLKPRWGELDPARASRWERFGEGEPAS